MSEKPYKLLLLGLLIVVFLFATWPYQFQHAWQSGYTYAGSPAAMNVMTSSAIMNDSKENKPLTSLPINSDVGNIAPQPALSDRIVNYHIQVNLNEELNVLEGDQVITWRNPGKQQVQDLYLHLYANAFKSPQTTFMQESGGKLRSDQATANSEGYINLTSLESMEGESLLPRLKFVSPDDGNHEDYTVATFRLLEPVAPGEDVTLRLKFEVKLPEVFARMGYAGEFIMAGQWFPKVAVYETENSSGKREGWNVHQYHGNSEFYSNFGVYSVKIHVPEHYVVAGTGMQTKVTKLGQGRKMVSFYAEDVHDFAFSASPDFITHEASYSGAGVPGVKLKLYVDKEHDALSERYLHAAKSALSYFGKNYGTYPYSTLSIVVPPKGASGAGGMEYPTLVTALAADNENPGYELERTVIHEIAHQYWYGIIANNEFEEAWLDEAFASYTEEKVMEYVYGVKSDHRIEASYITAPAPLKLDAWSYDNHSHYAENVYLRGKLLLLDLEQLLGSELMTKVMRSYFQSYQFKHPTTAQFQEVLEQVTKRSWQSYFDSYVYANETNDLVITKIDKRKFQEMNKDIYEYTILLSQNSAVKRIVPIELVYENGAIVRKEWEIGDEANLHFVERSEVPLSWIKLDPDQSNKLDTKLNNNFMRAELPEPERKAVAITATSLLDSLLRLLSW